MLGLNPKFEKLLDSLKQTHDIEGLAKLSIRNIDDNKDIQESQSFINNTTPNGSIANIANTNLMLIAPSLLAANFLRLEEEIKSIVEAGCDLLHIDIMDGHFVPNMTVGPCVLEEIPRICNIPLDIHLMVEDADSFIDLYAPLSPHFISVHIESERHLHRIIQKIRSYNISPAVVLNPHTSPQSLKYILNDIDMVLVMSVNPGFGGQDFIASSIEKIVDLKEMILMKNAKCLIEVDGGVNDSNIAMLKNAGVDIVVAGSYIFRNKNRKEAIASLKI